MMKGLTEKQQDILKFIGEFAEREHMAPTVYEIADHAGIKTSTVFAHVRALQRKNKLTRTSQARSIKLTNVRQRSLVHEHIAVLPMENASGLIDELLVDRRLLRTDEKFFALKVPDNAMRDFGIFIDDIVIVKATQEFNSGDLIVVKIGEQVQIRSAYLKPQKEIEIRPGNADFAAQTYLLAAVIVRGVVVALQREY